MDAPTGRNVVQLVEDYPRSEYPGRDPFGARQFLITLRRRWRLAFAVLAAVVLLGVAYALLRPPVYEASAVMMMRPNAPPESAAVEQQRARDPDNGYVQSQVEILRSPALAQQVADRLGEPSAAEALEVQRRDGTYIVEVAGRANDPEKAARLANDLVNVYFSSREQSRIEYASRTSDWLNGRLNDLRTEVRMREAEVEAYRAQHGLLTIDGAVVAEQRLRDAEQSLVAARADQAERNARQAQVAQMVSRGGTSETTAGALSSETMTQLRARQADVARQLAEYGERYGDRHPQVLASRAEQDDINRQIQAEAARVAQNLGDEAQIASARVATMQGHLVSVRRELAGNNAEQVRLRELERNATAARTVYENFLLRYHEVSDGAAAGLGGDATLVTAATPPDAPISRSPFLIILLAAALGAVAGALAAFLAEQFSQTLQTADDVERKAGINILTSIPHLRRANLNALPQNERHPAGFAIAKPMSAFAEAMRVLRARIVHSSVANGAKIVAVTSAMAGEGKSSISLSLARVTALSNRKAIILDCDLRRRSLNHLLGIAPRTGITQVLRGELDWRSATGRDEYSGADVLPAAEEDFVSEDLFNTDAMRRLMRELSAEYDLIVIDCAPVLTLADVRDLGALADGVVLVARRGKTETMALQAAVNELRAVNATILGVAFNDVDINAPGRLSYADPLYFSHAERYRYIK